MTRRFSSWIARHLACALASFGLVVAARAQGTAAAGSSWQLSGSVSQGFDNNIQMGFGSPEADTTTQVQLGLGRTWTGSRWSFVANYYPEAEAYAHHPGLDFYSNAYHQTWTYALGPHTQLIWSTGVERYPERGGAPSGGLPALAATANASQAMALASVFTGGTSTLTINQQYNLHSNWSASLTGSLQDFTQDQSLAGLGPSALGAAPMVGRSQSVAGNLNWSHTLTETTSLQIGGGQSNLWYSNPRQQVRYDNLQASLQQRIGSNLSLQIGAGPAWNQSQSTAPTGVLVVPGHSYAANASLSAQFGQDRYGLSWQHADQLGLTPGGLTTDMLAFNYGVQWARVWSAGFSVGQSRGTAAPVAGFANTGQDSAFASGQMRWSMAANWSLQANANYYLQSFPATPSSTQQLRRLQVSLGVAYTSGGAR